MKELSNMQIVERLIKLVQMDIILNTDERLLYMPVKRLENLRKIINKKMNHVRKNNQ